jgi:hypothetical protein
MLHHMQQDGPCREHIRLALAAKPDLEGARQLLAELDSPRAPANQARAAVDFEAEDDGYHGSSRRK